eukprot:5803684-Pyramimonas_sp.AAC.1
MAFKSGAQAAHRFTRVRSIQMALESSGFADPPQLADGELANWKKIWRVHGAGRLPLPGGAETWGQLMPLSGAGLQRVIGAFALRAGRGQ